MHVARPPEPLDNRVALETPEHVALSVSLAGVGARGAAWAVDTLLRVVVGFFLGIVLLMLGGTLGGLGAGGLYLLIFALDWVWFAGWEALDSGHSPGKRVFGLRVLRVDGTPIGAREAMLRNLVRVADVFPGFYLVGVLSVVFDGRFRRLGDLVAGTVVVRELRMEPAQPSVWIHPPLSPTEDLVLPRHRRVTVRDRRALEEWLATSERFGLVWSEWVAARVVDSFARRYRLGGGGRPVRVLQRLLGAARAAQPELERAAAAGQDQARGLRDVLNRHAGRLSAADAPELVARLRAVVAELGRLRDVAPSRARAAEELAWEAEALLHRGAARRSGPGALRGVHQFLFVEFPAALRRNAGLFLLCSALFWLPFVGVALGAALDPEFCDRMLPPAMRANLAEWYRHPESRSASDNTEMAGFYVLNNVGIALRAAGAGVLGGIGTAWVLVSNGISIGAAFGFAAREGFLGNLLRYTSGHSAWELTAVVVSGTAGMRLGVALLAPGEETRAASLRRAGPDVARLAGGAAAMLVVAASIEGFWSATVFPDWLKAGFALIQVALCVVWLGGFAGRRR